MTQHPVAAPQTVGAQVLPNFVMAPILVIVFTLWLGWLPGGGWQGGQWQFIIMPVIALSTSYMASIARLSFGNTVDLTRGCSNPSCGADVEWPLRLADLIALGDSV